MNQWLTVTGSRVKKIRLRKGGLVDLIVSGAPSRRNPKRKKRAKKRKPAKRRTTRTVNRKRKGSKRKKNPRGRIGKTKRVIQYRVGPDTARTISQARRLSKRWRAAGYSYSPKKEVVEILK